MSLTQYSTDKFPFMKPRGPHMYVSDHYTSVPPALVIEDDEGALWTLGFDQGGFKTGEFEYDVVRTGPEPGAKPQSFGEFACRIEFRRDRRGRSKVMIFGRDGWRTWTGKSFI